MEFITVKRTVAGDTTNSSLGIDKNNKLSVIGGLPHNCDISFDKENAEKLINWLKANCLGE